MDPLLSLGLGRGTISTALAVGPPPKPATADKAG